MLDLLRQLSAGNPSVVDSMQAPIAQGQSQAQGQEIDAPIFNVPLVDVANEPLEVESELLLELEPALVSEDLAPQVIVTAQERPALPSPDLAEQWLAGMLGQQTLQVQAVSRQAPEVQHYAQKQPEPIVAVKQQFVGVSTRTAQSFVMPEPTKANTPAPSVVPVNVSQPVVEAGAGAVVALPALQEVAGSLESVKPTVTEVPVLTTTSVATRAPVTLPVERPEHALTEQLMQKVRQSIDVQVRQNIQSATIRLDPPELGSLEIFLSHESGRLQVSIQAANADVSRLLLQTSDRLRQDLVTANYLQVNVQVGSEGQSGREQRRSAYQQEQVLNAQVFDEPQNLDRIPTDVLVTV